MQTGRRLAAMKREKERAAASAEAVQDGRGGGDETSLRSTVGGRGRRTSKDRDLQCKG